MGRGAGAAASLPLLAALALLAGCSPALLGAARAQLSAGELSLAAQVRAGGAAGIARRGREGERVAGGGEGAGGTALGPGSGP